MVGEPLHVKQLSLNHVCKIGLNMELDLQSLFGLHVHSCTQWLRPRTLLPPPLGSYTRALLVSQDRRHWPLTPKKGLEKGLGRCWAAAQSTCLIWPSYKLFFPPTPCLVHRVHAKPPVFWEGTLVPSFVCTEGTSLSSRSSDPLGKISGSSTLRLKLQALENCEIP